MMIVEHLRGETIRNLVFLLAGCIFSGCSVATWSVEQSASPDVEIVVGQTSGDAKEIVGFTPLGDLVVLTKSGRLMLLDAETGEPKMEIESRPYGTSRGRVSLASNGILASSYWAEGRSTVSRSIWDTSVYPPKQTFRKEYDGSTPSFRMSPDGSAMAMIDWVKNEVSLWDPKRGKRIRELDMPKSEIQLFCHPMYNPKLKFSSNGKYLAVLRQRVTSDAANGARLRIFSVPEGTLQHSWYFPLSETSRPDVSVCHLSDDGRRVLFYLGAGVQRESMPDRWWLCDVSEGKKMLDVMVYPTAQWSPYRSRLFGLACGAPTGQYILSRKEDGSGVCAYDLETGKRCGEWGWTGVSLFFLFGDTLVQQCQGSVNPRLEFWDLKTNQMISTIPVFSFTQIKAISPDGQLLVFPGMEVFRRSDGMQLLALRQRGYKTDPVNVSQYVFSRDSERLAFLCDGTVGIIDLESLQPKNDATNGSDE